MIVSCGSWCCLGRSPAENHLPAVIQTMECMKKKKPISEEQHYLCEIGLEKLPYRFSWLFESYTLSFYAAFRSKVTKLKLFL